MLSAKTILKGLNLMSNSYFTRKLLNIKDKAVLDKNVDKTEKKVKIEYLHFFYSINELNFSKSNSPFVA